MIKINLEQFLLIQKELNEKIFRSREVTYDLIKHKSHLALMVELMELCNSTRCFNYWSKKSKQTDDEILEEFADVLCFSFSEYLAFSTEAPPTSIEFDLSQNTYNNDEIVKQFDQLIHLYCLISDQQSILNFLKELFILGYMLDFDIEQIFAAYQKKCIKNHQVQDNW